MQPETPAQGILKESDYGDSIVYYVPCECSHDAHAHRVEIEADSDFSVNVYIYTTSSSPVFSKSRWKQIWDLLTKGYHETEAVVLLKHQQALNYAAALQDASKKVSEYQQKRQQGKNNDNSTTNQTGSDAGN